MATQPAFATVPKIGLAQVSTANTNRDGTGTIVDVITGATNGTRIAEIVCESTGTTTAGMIRLYLTDGTNTRLFDEISIAAATPSASVRATRVSTIYTNLILPSSSWKLRASTHNAETINVIALGADL